MTLSLSENYHKTISDNFGATLPAAGTAGSDAPQTENNGNPYIFKSICKFLFFM
jgi:hypothetical protein